MKRVVGLLVLVALGVGGWLAARNVGGHDVYALSVAFGIPDETTIEMHVVASMGMTVTEPPRVDPLTGKTLWEEWVEQHFDLRDADGKRVTLGLRSHSDIVPKHKVVGTPEGYLAGRVTKGVSYTFDYIPKRLEAKRYRYEFNAPEADTAVERIAMAPV